MTSKILKSEEEFGSLKKTIFITGTSSGLGKASAKLFHQKGWNVIATMRKPEEEEELTQLENVTVLPLDVTNVDQINETVKNILALTDVDVVFNNAGIGQVSPLEMLTDEQIVTLINTNLLGVIRVTKAFIPYFREKKGGLFLNTSSLNGLVTFPVNSIYHASKWGLEGWSEGMSYELDLFNIGIKIISPGGISTEFGGSSEHVGEHPAYNSIIERFRSLNVPENFSTAEAIAEVVYEAATDGKKQLSYLAGDVAHQMYGRRLEIGREASLAELKQMIIGDLLK